VLQPDAVSGGQMSGDARGDCLILSPLPNFSIEQWRMVVFLLEIHHFVTSQYDIKFRFVNQRFGDVC